MTPRNGLFGRAFRRAVLLPSALFCMLWAPEAEAVRPFVTDDARIVDVGQIEMEMWLEMPRSEGDFTPGFHGMFGATFNEWLEIITGTGFNMRRRSPEFADPIFQPKMRLSTTYHLKTPNSHLRQA